MLTIFCPLVKISVVTSGYKQSFVRHIRETTRMDLTSDEDTGRPTLRQRLKKLEVPQPDNGAYAIDSFTCPGKYCDRSHGQVSLIWKRRSHSPRPLAVCVPDGQRTHRLTHQRSRTWRSLDYVSFWATGGFAIYNYSTGSALIAFGLSGPQALAAGIFSPIALAVLCVLCGVSVTDARKT